MDDKRIISKEQGEETAKQYGMKFFETSAKTGLGIKDAFETIAAQIIENIEEQKTQRKANNQNGAQDTPDG